MDSGGGLLKYAGSLPSPGGLGVIGSGGEAGLKSTRAGPGPIALVRPPRLNQDGAEVVDIGARRPGDDQIVKGGEDGIGVVVVEPGARVEAERAGAAQRIGRGQGAGVVLAAVDAIGVGRERKDSLAPVEREREAEEEFAVAAAMAAAAHCDRRLAAGEDDAGRADRLAVTRGAERNARVHDRAFARLAFDRVAENERGIAGLAGARGGRVERAERGGDKAILDLRQPRVARLRRLAQGIGEMSRHGRRQVDSIAREDFPRIG